MRCRSRSNTNRLVPMPSGILLVAALLAGAVSAQYSETTTYNDEACQDLNSTLVVNGILGLTEVTPFYSCTNATNGSAQSYSYECANDEAVTITFDNDNCSGEGSMNVTLFNSSCTAGQLSTCSFDEPYVSTNWTVEATFYTNDNCSVSNGETRNYTMPQFMDLYQENGSCESVDYSGIPLFSALSCVDGKLGWVYYNESDSTCSSDVVVVEADVYDCVTSAVAAGPYLNANCTDIMDTSGWGDDDDWNGGDDFFNTSWNDFFNISWNDWNGSDDFFNISWNDNNDSDWDVLFNSTVRGTFYSDENCSVPNGQTSEFTMLEFMELYEMNETCADFVFGSYLFGIRCIDGEVGYAFYNRSDSTCSLDVVGVWSDLFGCEKSASGMSTLGAYLETNCTEIAETSDTDDSDDNNDTPAPTTDDTPAPTPGSDDDSSGGVSSFHLAGRIIRYSWSIAAATVTALATALV